MLLTYNLRIRNTDPRFRLVSCYKKHFLRSQMKNAVSYMWDVTVITEDQSKAGNDMKSLSSIFARTSWDRSQHLLQND